MITALGMTILTMAGPDGALVPGTIIEDLDGDVVLALVHERHVSARRQLRAAPSWYLSRLRHGEYVGREHAIDDRKERPA